MEPNAESAHPLLRIVIEGDPYPQPRPQVQRATGRVYYPDKTGALKEWNRRLERGISAARVRFPPSSRLAVDMHFFVQRPPTHFLPSGKLTARSEDRVPRYDVDNLAKTVLDMMTYLGVMADDKWVVDLRVRKDYVSTGGCLHLSARAL